MSFLPSPRNFGERSHQDENTTSRNTDKLVMMELPKSSTDLEEVSFREETILDEQELLKFLSKRPLHRSVGQKTSKE